MAREMNMLPETAHTHTASRKSKWKKLISDDDDCGKHFLTPQRESESIESAPLLRDFEKNNNNNETFSKQQNDKSRERDTQTVGNA